MALEHNAYLGRDDLGKLLRSFSLPCILSHKFSIQGVLYAGPAADAIAMLVAVVLTVRFFQQMNRQAKKD